VESAPPDILPVFARLRVGKAEKSYRVLSLLARELLSFFQAMNANRYSRLFWITAMSISSPSVCSGEKKSLQKCNDRLILLSVFRLQLCRLHSV